MDSSYISDDNFIISTSTVYVILQFIMCNNEHVGNELWIAHIYIGDDDFMVWTTAVYVILQLIMSGNE